MPWDGEYPELFAPLSANEMWKVYKYLVDNDYIYERDPEAEEVSLKTNYVPYMYLLLPNKEAVKKYKHNTGPYPGR